MLVVCSTLGHYTWPSVEVLSTKFDKIKIKTTMMTTTSIFIKNANLETNFIEIQIKKTMVTIIFI